MYGFKWVGRLIKRSNEVKLSETPKVKVTSNIVQQLQSMRRMYHKACFIHIFCGQHATPIGCEPIINVCFHNK